MKRRQFLKTMGLGGLTWAAGPVLGVGGWGETDLKASDFGADFSWGVATAAYQIEGAWDKEGKGRSIWDDFTQKRKRKIRGGENGNEACDFFNRYEADLDLLKALNFKVFRFSLAWSRILPKGRGEVNEAGLVFYDKVIEACLARGLEPWITLYHWDLPSALQREGGWANRGVLADFEAFCKLVVGRYGGRVKHWMILNEPAAFTALGHLAGIHAPGKISPKKFLAAVHHATLAMGIGARVVRDLVVDAKVGTTFSCSPVEAKNGRNKHNKAAQRLDVLLNRLFIEPILGLGYPIRDWSFLRKIRPYILEGDAQLLPVNFDFIGLQNYTRVVAKKALVPFIRANQIKPKKRGVPLEQQTLMDWEVYPQGMYEVLKQFAAYENLPPLYITENGAAFSDVVLETGQIADVQRVQYFKDYLGAIYRAKREGLDIRGYFVWTFLDNFEWAEGYRPRFGIVHVDFKTQERRVKDSGLWFRDWLKT